MPGLETRSLSDSRAGGLKRWATLAPTYFTCTLPFHTALSSVHSPPLVLYSARGSRGQDHQGSVGKAGPYSDRVQPPPAAQGPTSSPKPHAGAQVILLLRKDRQSDGGKF